MLGSERSAMTGVDLDDLDQEALERFVIDRAPELVAALGRDDAAIRLGLLAKVAPRLAPTQVGLYVFGKVPQYVAPEWGVACVAFDGRTLSDPIASRVDVEGPLTVLVAKVLAFVDEAQRGPSARYSPEIVREVVVNALVHRDLRRPSRVSVRLFADRLEVHSPGGPPEGYADLDDLAREGGVSVPRNPLLASVARRLGLGEQLGRGLVRIVTEGSAGLDERVEIRATAKEVLVCLPPSIASARTLS
jgi:predicted HTH transcriptional regulator